MTKLAKRGFAVEYINVHKLFLNDDGSFKAIVHWYASDNYHVLNYGAYFIHKQFMEASGNVHCAIFLVTPPPFFLLPCC